MTHYDICRRSAKAHTTKELVEMIDKLDKATLIADDLEMFNALKDELEWRKKRALKQAIRATHSGTMGDPMRPTTR